MPLSDLPPGLNLDRPLLASGAYWRAGKNIRFRLGLPETLGLFGPVRDAAGVQQQMPNSPAIRTLFNSPSVSEGQVLAASASAVYAFDFDTGSTPGTGTCWARSDVTPAGLAAVNDVVSDPGVGRIEIPPTWWFADQEDVIVGGRANVTDDPVYAWDRDTGAVMTPLAGSPTGAVGGGIMGRILVLLGCTSFTDPDPQRYMTIRWSDRFNFEDWTPSDINVSGEMQLEGGSRIMGGGVVSQGILAWTDKRMALLTETGDPDSVFARRYIDGGRGLMANRSWAEADGVVWWYDETRTLNRWDGGRPSQVHNTLRLGTLERASDRDMARAYMVANQEFREVILWYPTTDNDICDQALVYNYDDDAWSLWALPRNAWAQRVGATRNWGVDDQGRVFQHDLDTSIVAPWLPDLDDPVAKWPAPVGTPMLTDITPYDWFLQTNLVTTSEPTSEAYHLTRNLLDHIPSPSADHTGDTFTMTVTGFGDDSITAQPYNDAQTIVQGQTWGDFRVGGKAIQITARGTGCGTVWRFGQRAASLGGDGER